MRVGATIRAASFNAVRLGSGLLAVALTPLLVRELPPAEFGLWTLVMQLPTYVNLLAGGLIAAVTRQVAASRGSGEPVACRLSIVAFGFEMYWRAALVALLVVLGLSVLAPILFSDVPTALAWDARIGFGVVGAASVVAASAAPTFGYFNGVQENATPSILLFLTRLCAVAAAGLLVAGGSSVRAAFVAVAAGFAVSAVVQVIWYRRAVGSFSGSECRTEGPHRSAIAAFMSTAVIWSMANLAANGLDVALVGALDFDSVGVYGAALGVALVFAGVNAAVLNAALPDFADSIASGDLHESKRAFRLSTRLSGLLLGSALASSVIFGRFAMKIWVGEHLADEAHVLLVAIILSRGAQNVMQPYVVSVIASGEHAMIRTTPIVEGVVNLVISAAMVAALGAVGAAIGTAVGSLVAVLLHAMHNVPRTPGAVFLGKETWVYGVGWPALLLAVSMTFVALRAALGAGHPLSLAALFAALGCFCYAALSVFRL